MEQNFSNWLPLRELRVADFPNCGDCCAVYALRDCRSSEIIKFGQTDTLRRRIFGNFVGGIGGHGGSSTTQFVHQRLFCNSMIDHVEISWIVTKDKTTAKLMENQFRQSYKTAHDGHRPLWDRNG
jgi:hypothetical protein